jgi:HlyD family secretion protein
VTAALAEVDGAAAALQKEQASLDRVLQSASSEDFVAAEQRLSQANTAYQTASVLSARARAVKDDTDLQAAAQDGLDAAKAELDAAKLAYSRLLTATTSRDVLEARARVAVAQARLDTAYASAASVQTGEQSLQVQAARAGVVQAETAVTQAQAMLAQAQAAVDVVTLQLGRAAVAAPTDGTVLSRAIEPGEFVAAGSIAMTIADLREVRLVVYVPENEYGRIKLEQPVSVAVDAYPGRAFAGRVISIANEAEFTPRNTSTAEGRKSTVFAVEILLPNADQTLKPGMPADVTF